MMLQGQEGLTEETSGYGADGTGGSGSGWGGERGGRVGMAMLWVNRGGSGGTGRGVVLNGRLRWTGCDDRVPLAGSFYDRV